LATTGYRYRPFGGFRLFLAFLVVLQHFVANAGPLGPLYDHVIPYEVGNIAVLVFFCLSGFVITEAATLIYSERPFAYLFNRFLRIVPHFLVALVIAVVIHAAFQRYGTLRISDREHPDLLTLHAFDLSNILGNILGFMPGVNRFLSFDFVDIIWAVRVEMVFYFAVFFALLIPNRHRLSSVLPYALVVLGLATAFIARQFGFGFFFLFGVLLYDRRRHSVSLALCGVGMSLFFFLSQLHPDAYHQQAIMTQYCILVVLVGVMTWLAFKTGPRNARDQACGELSYPLYIHHQNVLILTISLTSGYSYPVLAIGVALSLIASYGLMRLVDPAVNRMRNLIRGKSLEPAKCPPTILAAVELVH
jgi:peptidoglycan/LPS O-acetylase OafA/YrhL